MREAIAGRPEFRELTFQDFIVVDYLIQKPDSFPNPLEAPDERYYYKPERIERHKKIDRIRFESFQVEIWLDLIDLKDQEALAN